MTGEIQNYDDKIVVSSSRLGKVSKLPLLSLRSVGSKFKITLFTSCPAAQQRWASSAQSSLNYAEQEQLKATLEVG